MSKRRNRNQTSKSYRPVANPTLAEGMRELRKGSRTTPVASGTLYRRKPKYPGKFEG